MGMKEKKPENVVLSGNLSERSAGTLISEHEMRERHQRFISAATSENTRRTYRSAIRHFYAWGGVLPCDSGAALRYLLAYSDSLNPRTLALRLTALAQWHAFQGFPDPTADPGVRKTLKGVMRTRGKPRKKAKALPIEDLEAIVAKLGPDTSLIAIRNNALLQIGFFGALRRSELAALMVEELAWEADGLVITLARSKTDQEGEGVSKAIPYGGPDGICCPVRALKRWLEAANITSGAVFRRVTRWGVIGADPLSDGSINDILEACAKAADLAYAPELSSHSLRRGLATSAHRSGADFKDIKRQGGWRHDGTVQGYIEEAARFEANAALTLLRRKGKNGASKP